MKFSFVTVVASITMVGSLALCCFPLFFSYAEMKSYADALSYSNGVDFFTPEYFAAIVTRLRALAALSTTVAVIGILFRKKISSGLREYGQRLLPSCRVWWREARPETSWILTLLLIVVAGCCIRLLYLQQPMQPDEARTYNAYASRPLPIVLSDWTAPNNQILHTALVKVSASVFGNHEWALRLPAMVFGVILILLSGFLGRSFYTKGAGLIAASLVATSWSLMFYSVNARGYTMVAVFTCMLAIAARRLADRSGCVSAWTVWITSAVLGAFTIPIMVYSYVGMSVWLLLAWYQNEEMSRPQLMRLVFVFVGVSTLVLLLVLLCYVPALIATDWALISDDPALVGDHGRGEAFLLIIMSIWDAFILSMCYLPSFMLWVLAGLLLFGVFIKKVIHPAPLICIAVMAIGMVMLHGAVPYARIWTIFIPFCYIEIASSLDWVCRKLSTRNWSLEWTASGVLAILLNFSMLAAATSDFHPNLLAGVDASPSLPEAVKYLQQNQLLDHTLLAHMPVPGPLVYYLGRQGVKTRVWDLYEYKPTIKDVNPSSGLLFFVNRWYGQNIEALKRSAPIYQDWGEPPLTKIWSDDFLELYETTTKVHKEN